MRTVQHILALASVLAVDGPGRELAPASLGPVYPRPYDADAAARIRAERAVRKAENFAKRNPARVGATDHGMVALCMFGILIVGLLAGAVLCDAHGTSSPEPTPDPAPAPAPTAIWHHMPGNGNYSPWILTDPKSGHRWLVIGPNHSRLEPGEFEPLPEGK